MPARRSWNCTTTARAGHLALHAGLQPAGAAPAGAVRGAQQAIRLSGQPPQHDGDRACIICHNPIPKTPRNARSAIASRRRRHRPGRCCGCGLRQAVPAGAAVRLPADVAGHGRRDGAAVPDHAADGRCADPFRTARPSTTTRSASTWAACWPRLSWRGAWAGPAPSSWPGSASGSARTCAPPPTNTCRSCRWNTSAASAPAT